MSKRRKMIEFLELKSCSKSKNFLSSSFQSRSGGAMSRVGSRLRKKDNFRVGTKTVLTSKSAGDVGRFESSVSQSDFLVAAFDARRGLDLSFGKMDRQTGNDDHQVLGSESCCFLFCSFFSSSSIFYCSFARPAMPFAIEYKLPPPAGRDGQFGPQPERISLCNISNCSCSIDRETLWKHSSSGRCSFLFSSGLSRVAKI